MALRRWLWFWALLCTSFLALEARADNRSDARKLATEGFALYEKGSYSEAIDRFKRADELYRAPVHRVYIGRSLRKLGRWLDAEHAFLRAADMPATATDPPSFEVARTTAREELAKLKKRIPSVRILVPDTAKERVQVTLDDKAVQADKAVRVDPGMHVIGMQIGSGPVSTQDFEAREGTAECIQVSVTDPVATNTEASSGTEYIWPGLAFGIGGFGVALGAITGGIAAAKSSDVSDRCPDDQCPPDIGVGEDAGTANTLATVSLASLIAGGVGILAGIVTVVVLDDDEGDVELQAGPAGLWVSGSF